MSEFTSLENHFLIAMPTLQDPNFERTVTLICQHNPDGALGIVINRITNLKVSDILEQLNIESALDQTPDDPVYFGGPVQTERGMILHASGSSWDSTLPVGSDFGLTTSRDILEAIGANRGPDHCLLALGYAGWGTGQLEREISENAWLSGPASEEIIFHTPVTERWAEAAKLLGVDITSISLGVGHA